MLRAERPTAPGTKGTALLRQSFSGENVWICAVMEWPSLYPSACGVKPGLGEQGKLWPEVA